MAREGTLKTWNAERAFGFIAPTDGGPDVFVHITAFGEARVKPQPGLAVSFEVESTAGGKLRARSARLLAFEPSARSRAVSADAAAVAPAAPARAAPARSGAAVGGRPTGRPLPRAVQWGTASYFAIAAFGALFLAAAVLWRVPGWVALAYLGLSGACFLVYALDKSAAQARLWRVSESTLHLLALAGGWPGAIVAQQVLRHKSAKLEFRAVFWVTVVLNVIGFLVVVSPLGRLLAARLLPLH